MKRLFLFAFVGCLLPSAEAQTVRIAAAANLKFVLDDIRTLYISSHPDATIDLTYGSSGLLCQQILSGATFDIFLSADRSYPERLAREKATTGGVRTYAFGKLALWSTTIDVADVGIVNEPSVRSIAIGKPDVAPYGDRAIQCLKSYGLYDKVRQKLVYADNISQAAEYVATGSADAGFVPLSLLRAPGLKKQGSYVVLDEKSYAPIEQGGVLIAAEKPNAEAVRFFDFLTGPACKQIFEKNGYNVP